MGGDRRRSGIGAAASVRDPTSARPHQPTHDEPADSPELRTDLVVPGMQLAVPVQVEGADRSRSQRHVHGTDDAEVPQLTSAREWKLACVLDQHEVAGLEGGDVPGEPRVGLLGPQR